MSESPSQASGTPLQLGELAQGIYEQVRSLDMLDDVSITTLRLITSFSQ